MNKIKISFLNKLIISSDCPNGPKEILVNNFNSIKYELNNYKGLSKVIIKLLNNEIKNQFQLKVNMKNFYFQAVK